MVHRNPGKGEIIPLHNNSSNQNCMLTEDVDLTYADDDLYGTVAFGVLQGVPLICGGSNAEIHDKLDECIAIGHPNLKKIKMLEKRGYTSGVVLDQPSKSLWVVGGWNSQQKDLSTTEFVYLDKPSEKGPDLPFTIHSHCMIKYNQSSVFIMGGYQDGPRSDKTWIIDPTKNFTIEKGPSLNSPKSEMACGKMKIEKKIWLVVGPCGGNTFDIELLDPSNLSQGWIEGENFKI